MTSRPLSSRDEPLLLDPHIVAVAQHREGRGVGRGTADAELLHPLDQRRLGVARRRLGEMLGRVDALFREPLALAHRRQAARIPRPPRRPGLPDRGRGSRESARPGRWRGSRAGARRPPPECRRSCARVRRSPSGRRWCGSRSVRRAWPARARDGARRRAGGAVMSVGRIASCASCAFLALAVYLRGAPAAHSRRRNPCAITRRAAATASGARSTPSVRI